jgi:hypothetical protein
LLATLPIGTIQSRDQIEKNSRREGGNSRRRREGDGGGMFRV